MRIGLVVQAFSLARGGGEAHAVHLARSLVARSHAVHVFARSADPEPPPGVIVHRVRGPGAPGVLRVLWFLRATRRALARVDLDVAVGLTQIYPQDVHRVGGGLQSVWRDVATAAWPARLRAALSPMTWAQRFLESRIFSPGGLRRVVANSALCRDQVCARAGVPRSRVHVVRNGVDTTRFHPGLRAHRASFLGAHDVPVDALVLLLVTNNFARKGVATAIDALALVRAVLRSAHLVVVGAGRAAPYERLARRRGVSGHVHFTGPLPDVERAYGAADIALLPTLYDPCANVTLEAMAAGLPVITSRMNGAAEVVRTPGNGLIVSDPRDARALAEAIITLKDPARRAAMGAAARDAVAPLTWDAHASAMEDVLAAAAAERMADVPPERVPSPQGLVLVHPAYRELVEKNGWDDLETVMGWRGGDVVKRTRQRSVVRLRATTDAGEAGLYLKRHGRARVPDVVRRLLHGSGLVSDGGREWDAAHLLRSLGIPALRPVACGERRRAGYPIASFSLTREVEGAERLEDYIPRHLATLPPRERRARKALLSDRLAEIVRVLHHHRVCHRDLYLGHVFVRDDGGVPVLTLIDLQRVERRWWLSRRMCVKELASLQVTAPAPEVTRADRVRFLCAYLGVAPRDRAWRPWARAIERKAARIRRHTAVLLARRRPAREGDPQRSS